MAAGAAAQRSFRFNRAWLAQFGVFFAIVIVALVFAALTNGVFLSGGNLANIGRQTTNLAIASFAMTLVILSGEIDISIGAIAGLAAVIMASLLRDGVAFPVAILAGVAAGGVVGLINGVIAIKGRIPSFIVTLGTLSIIRGIALGSTNASTIVFTDDLYRDLFARGNFIGVPAPVWFALILFVVLNYVLTQTRFGSNIYAIGGNAVSARLAGIPVDRVKILVFVISGMFAALAAIIFTARVGNGQAEAASGLELDAIAAVVLGGTSFAGGRGSLVRTVFGALLIGMLNNGLTLMNVDFNLQQVAKAIVIVLAVYLDYWTRKGSGSDS
jgi:ribose transport system permease protein